VSNENENASFELPSPDRFTAGTIGEPGQRMFFLQAEAAGHLVTLKCEKQQVGALAEHLASLLADLPVPADQEVEATDVDFVPPHRAEWIVGRMGVAWDEGDDRLVLQCEELVAVDADEDDPVAAAAELVPATARFRLTRAQVAAFVEVARDLVASGRPPCDLCGGPMDPAGHACPRLN
jgi:uncharacterized repeat protein (TIGR03847 family)